MNIPTRLTFCLLTGALLAGFGAGCSKKPAAATPAELEASLRDAFKDGAEGARKMADAAADALQKQDRAQAFALLNGLSSAPELSPEQRQAAAHAATAMREQLAKDAAKGDQEAAALMQAYRSSK